MEKRDKTIAAALITAVAIVIGALITAPWWHSVSISHQKLVIAGTVVDQASNLAIGQATISLSGRTESYVTGDDGNFRIELRDSSGNELGVRIYVKKDGYRPYDEPMTPPAENLVIPLKKL